MGESPTWEHILATARLLDTCVAEKQRMEPALVLELARSILAFDQHLDRRQSLADPTPQARR